MATGASISEYKAWLASPNRNDLPEGTIHTNYGRKKYRGLVVERDVFNAGQKNRVQGNVSKAGIV